VSQLGRPSATRPGGARAPAAQNQRPSIGGPVSVPQYRCHSIGDPKSTVPTDRVGVLGSGAPRSGPADPRSLHTPRADDPADPRRRPGPGPPASRETHLDQIDADPPSSRSSSLPFLSPPYSSMEMDRRPSQSLLLGSRDGGGSRVTPRLHLDDDESPAPGIARDEIDLSEGGPEVPREDRVPRDAVEKRGQALPPQAGPPARISSPPRRGTMTEEAGSQRSERVGGTVGVW